MQALCETPYFHSKASKLLGEVEYETLIAMLAINPKQGDLIRGTGGLRKIRIAREGKGKSGGYRVVYFFWNERMPVYLLDVFAKNRQSDLTPAQRSQLANIVTLLKQEMREKT